jgi:hypothetical protein
MDSLAFDGLAKVFLDAVERGEGVLGALDLKIGIGIRRCIHCESPPA